MRKMESMRVGGGRGMRTGTFAASVLLLGMGTALGAAPDRDWHGGLNVRTDFGTRFFRADAGVRFGSVDLYFAFDPTSLSTKDNDLDLVLRYEFASKWSVWGGGRATFIPVNDDRQIHEKALLGVSALLPRLIRDRLRLHAGLEMAIHVVRHGAELDTVWLCVDSGRCRKNHFVFSLFTRVEYATPF